MLLPKRKLQAGIHFFGGQEASKTALALNMLTPRQ